MRLFRANNNTVVDGCREKSVKKTDEMSAILFHEHLDASISVSSGGARVFRSRFLLTFFSLLLTQSVVIAGEDGSRIEFRAFRYFNTRHH